MSRKRRFRLESEWRKILRDWESSGENQSRFCKRQGIAASTFQKWRHKLKKSPRGSFVELLPAVRENAAPTIELELPHGITLRIKR